VPHAPPISFFSFYHPHNIGWGVQNILRLIKVNNTDGEFTDPVLLQDKLTEDGNASLNLFTLEVATV
jgi:hypothetical protein